MGGLYNPDILPRKLKEGREYARKSQRQIADKLNVHITSYNKWELGKNEPNAVALAAVADYENLDINFFFTPKMTPEEADMKVRDTDSALLKMAKRLEQVEKKVAPPRQEDPLWEKIRTNAQLLNICNQIKNLEGTILGEINALIFGYLSIGRVDMEEMQDSPAPQPAKRLARKREPRDNDKAKYPYYRSSTRHYYSDIRKFPMKNQGNAECKIVKFRRK